MDSSPAQAQAQQTLRSNIIVALPESIETIKAKRQENWNFHFELNNTTRIMEFLLEVQKTTPTRIPKDYDTMVLCAVQNRLYEDLKLAPMHISYVDLAPNPPQWLIELAAKNRAKNY